MPLHILVALAATAATPADKPTPPPADTAVAVKSESAAAKPDPAQAMAAMTKLFDKFFPAGPEPDAARLAMARDATMTMFPKGAYAEAMSGFMDRTVERAMNMSESDFAGMAPAAGLSAKDKKAKAPSTEPLRLTLARKDPTFDAKLAGVRAFAGIMLAKLGDVAEPKFREGMARSLARKFDERQLADISAFLATPTGAAYGRQMVGLWFEPDVMRGSLEIFPEMLKLMPAMGKDAAALNAQMKQGSPTAAKKGE